MERKKSIFGLKWGYMLVSFHKQKLSIIDRTRYTYSTIHKFKGMENSYIIIVDLDDMDEDRDHLDYYKSLLYIGMSRAKAGLIMLVNEGVKELLNLD